MTAAKIILVAALTVAVAWTGCYSAGAIYFVLCKSVPAELAADTWFRYWDAYHDNPLQARRLLMAAGLTAGALVTTAVMLIVATFKNKAASLHGDARWATTAEIRKAGLL